MTDTSSVFTYAREHAEQTWRMFTREKGLTGTAPAWQEETTPDGTPLLSGQLVGERAVYALSRFAHDGYVNLPHPGDVRPQFDLGVPGRTALVWRRNGVWVELWHPDGAVDAPTPVEPVHSAPVPPPAVQAAPEPVPGPSSRTKPRRSFLGPGGRLTFTRNRRKETNPA